MDRITVSVDLINQVIKFLEHLPFNQVANLIQAIIKDVEGQVKPKEEDSDVKG